MHPLLLGFHTQLHFLSVASHMSQKVNSFAALKNTLVEDKTRPLIWDESAPLFKEALSQYQDFLKGVTIYHATKRLPQASRGHLIMENSHLKIYAHEREAGRGEGPIVLFVPSLLNHGHIFDLLPDHSFFDYLTSKGVCPLLVEWKSPTPETLAAQGLGDYVLKLSQALHELVAMIPQGFHLAGYCMGGLLSLAVAEESRLPFKGIALLATPWLFEKTSSLSSDKIEELLSPFLDEKKCIPSSFLQLMFHSIEPFSIQKKFQELARKKDQGVDPSRFFLALEDWLTALRPLPWDVFKECLTDWYDANTPYHHHQIAGKKVRLDALPHTLVVIPTQDKIVKRDSALPLVDALPNPHVLMPELGHVGILVSQKAKEAFWEPFVHWLNKPTHHH
jgi:polyhydroxyalkanoate synthase